MKYLLLFFVSLFSLIHAQAQMTTNSYLDDFNENSAWPQYDDEDASGEIKKGKYILQSKLEQAFPQSYVYPYVDWKKDFTIEMEYKQSSFNPRNFSGIIWAKEGGDYNGFFLRMNSYFEIVTFRENVVEKIVKDWTKSEIISTINKTNKIKVEKSGTNYKFSINGTEVYTVSTSGFLDYNQGMGFIVEGLNTIEVDKFYFKQDIKIRTVENAHTPRVKSNLGMYVNTEYRDLNPIVSPDGKHLYYTITGHPENKKGPAQDIWYSTKITDSTWTKTKNMDDPINNKDDNEVISISPDNNTIYLLGKYTKRGKHVTSGFSYSQKTAAGWTVPAPLKILDFYNESGYQNASIGADNRTMIISAKMKDTKGGNDLYVSFLTDKKVWSSPLNLGSTVNSDFDETTPFLAADGKTVYFSTNGRPGYGDMDVFMVKRLDDTWTKWTEPQNLGPYINSIDFDAYFSVSGKAEYGYMVSIQNSVGEEDLVRIKLPESAKPNPVVMIHGKVYNDKTKNLTSANLTYEQLPSGKDLGHATTSPAICEYNIILPCGSVYGIFAEKNGFISKCVNIDLTKNTKYSIIEQDIYMSPIEVGEKPIINNLFFTQNTADILEASFPELDRIVELLKKSTKLEIEISGHTDNVGKSSENQNLSEKRAVAIKQYFVGKGIEEKRLSTVGYGDSQPIASNTKEETRKLNRRVEIKILKK